MSEKQTTADNRARNNTAEFREFIGQGWASTEASKLSPADVAAYTPRRRDELSAAFPGERLVIPAGGLKVRSNDCDYMFRAHTAFAYLTGIGAEGEPDSVLVLEPREQGGHDAVLFIRPLAPRDSEEFFHDARYGEYWVGARPTLEEAETTYGIAARHLDELPTAIGKDAGHVSIRVVRDADAEVTASVDQARQTAGERHATDEAKSAAKEQDSALAAAISSARMTKDDYEIAEMQKAVDATLVGFEAVIKDLPRAVGDDKGERWVEGVFGLHARHGGNGVGYDSICASGDHANTLHWIKNTGPIREGDLLLLDAGVEVDSLFTADITRTLPVSGTSPTHNTRSTTRCMRRSRPGSLRPSRATSSPTSTRPPSGSSPSTSTNGACYPMASTSRPPSTRNTGCTTAAGWCTARATTWASTCTTVG